MVIGIIGESCTGKTTLVEELKKHVELTVFSGKEYLKLDKNPQSAETKFKQLLLDAKEETIVYVITEKEHINLLPANALKVLVTADLDTIKERFKKRMHNNLPKPVEQMLERKHGMFDLIDCDVHLKSMDLKENVDTILKTIDLKKV